MRSSYTIWRLMPTNPNKTGIGSRRSSEEGRELRFPRVPLAVLLGPLMSAISALAVALTCNLPGVSADIPWEPLGLTGNGGMFAPAISPVDPGPDDAQLRHERGRYLTRDGGKHWTMIHQSQLRSSTRCRPAFHPTDARVIFAAQAGQGMKVSRDGGVHWQPVPGTPQRSLRRDRHRSRRSRSDDGRRRRVGGSFDGRRQDRGEPAGDRTARPWRSTSTRPAPPTGGSASRPPVTASGGRTTGALVDGEDERPALERDSLILRRVPGPRGSDVLYCTIPSQVEERPVRRRECSVRPTGARPGTSVMGGGINMDIAAADQWAHDPIAQYLWVLTTNVDPDIVYALNTNTGVYPPHHTATFRSDDAGSDVGGPRSSPTLGSSSATSNRTTSPRRPPVLSAARVRRGHRRDQPRSSHPGERLGLYHDQRRQTWKCGKRPAGGGDKEADWHAMAWWSPQPGTTTSIPSSTRGTTSPTPTSAWPGRSTAGRTWIVVGPQGSSSLAEHLLRAGLRPQGRPARSGAPSPTSMTYPTATSSTAATATVALEASASAPISGRPGSLARKGLPAAAAVSVVFDPKSPVRSRTLYVSLFNHGVYKSTDGGTTWQAGQPGPGAPADMRVCRLQLHRDGNLFVLVTAK